MSPPPSTLPAPASRNDPCPCGSGKRYKHCHGGAHVSGSPPPRALPTSAPPRAATPFARGSAIDAGPTADAGHTADAGPTADALARVGVAAHAAGDLERAEQHYRRALAAQPGHPLALHYLGVIRYQQGHLDEALQWLDEAVARVPGEPEFHNNRGLALAAARRNDAAIAAYERALALAPGHAGAWSNLGLARQEQGDVAAAIDAFRRGLDVAPDLPQLHWNLALALLLRGDHAAGWREYEWRLRTPELAATLTRYGAVQWAGDDPSGRTILVTCEQGLGDTIQHLRFVERLEQRGARVIVVVPSALSKLAGTARGVAAVVEDNAPLPAFDVHVSLMSLPHRLGIAHEADLSARVPYLHADALRMRDAALAIGREGNRLNVGLAWSGAPGNTRNAKRSIPLASLAPLLRVEGVRFFSLKREGEVLGVDDAPWIAKLANLDMRNDFDGLAALVASLDVIVSVDTSIAHLAGALGKEAWVPLAFVPDWRWLLDRPDSPWYPTARLFRQRVAGDWSAPVGEIAQFLRERVHGR